MGEERHIADVPPDAAPRVNKELDFATVDLTPEDYFVMTRVEGRTPLRQLVLIAGFPEARAREILGKLRDRGAILFPGDVPRPPPPRGAPTPPAPAPEDDPRLDEDVDLTPEQKRAILSKHASLGTATLFDVLGVPRDAARRDLKAAYRLLSKDFHPDRFFGRRLGSFGALLAEIFEVVSSALTTLSDDASREAYEAGLDAPPRPAASAPAAPASPLNTPPLGMHVLSPNARAAAEIYEEACMLHVSGELEKALTAFEAAIERDPQPRYLRRAAEVALKAQRLREAEDYAKKATELDAQNASSHRILGRVLAAKGSPHEARASLAHALRIDPQNPHIAAELRELDELAK
jgi:curved DNA-binding protein CbpA